MCLLTTPAQPASRGLRSLKFIPVFLLPLARDQASLGFDFLLSRPEEIVVPLTCKYD